MTTTINTDIARIDRIISKAIAQTNSAMALWSRDDRLNMVVAAMRMLSKNVQVKDTNHGTTEHPRWIARITVADMFELTFDDQELTYAGLDHIADPTVGATENIGLRLMQEARVRAGIDDAGAAPCEVAMEFSTRVSRIIDIVPQRQWPERNLTEWKYTLVVDEQAMTVSTWMRSDRRPTAGALLGAIASKAPLGFMGLNLNNGERYADFVALADAIWNDESTARRACQSVGNTSVDDLDKAIYTARVITGCL